MNQVCEKCEYKNNPSDTTKCLYCGAKIIMHKNKPEIIRNIMHSNSIEDSEYTLEVNKEYVKIIINGGLWLNSSQIMDLIKVYKPAEFGVMSEADSLLIQGWFNK